MDLISTIGPASWSESMIEALIESGVACFRFPFSKETPDIHVANAQRVHRVATRLGSPIRLLADLPGAKPRLSNERPVDVVAGHRYKIALTSDSIEADLRIIPAFTVPPGEVSGVEALIGDGDSTFHIESSANGTVTGWFTFTGILERRQALTIPGVSYRVQSFTDQDEASCEAIANGYFDTIALSFVQERADVDRARSCLIERFGWQPQLIAKIESIDGVHNVDAIADAADGVMIARGDLALQIGLENLWVAQQTITESCRRLGTYVIVATGLLDSLVHGTRPTRSEAIDVAAAVGLGVDALMLSAETTIGLDPVNAINTLKRLSLQANPAILNTSAS